MSESSDAFMGKNHPMTLVELLRALPHSGWNGLEGLVAQLLGIK